MISGGILWHYSSRCGKIHHYGIRNYSVEFTNIKLRKAQLGKDDPYEKCISTFFGIGSI